MDVTSHAVQVVPVAQRHQDGTPVLTVSETISAFAALADGTFLVAITPVPGTSQAASPTRLTRLSQTSATSVPARGLTALEHVSTLVGTPAGVLALAERRNGRPPNRVVQLDPQSGSATDRIQLPAGRRFTTLAQCPDGQLYTSVVGNDGETSLVNLTTGGSVQLSYLGEVWNNGLASLVCSATNQLFALGAMRGKWPNGVHLIDTRDGSLTRIADFDVAKMTLA
jgi:hypothetical protein